MAASSEEKDQSLQLVLSFIALLIALAALVIAFQGRTAGDTDEIQNQLDNLAIDVTAISSDAKAARAAADRAAQMASAAQSTADRALAEAVSNKR